jgi:four helix bundle protein
VQYQFQVNIAEEEARNTKKDFSRFLHLTQGSSAELQAQLLIGSNLGSE